MSNEKKKTIIFTIGLAVLAIALIVAFAITSLKQSGEIMSEETKEIMNKFDEYYNSKERKIIYYASTSCSWCEIQTPILENIANDYNIDYYYVDSSKLPAKQRNKILEKLGLKKHSTPNTFIVENGKVIDVVKGYKEGDELIEIFKDNKIVPDDAIYKQEQYITKIDYEQYDKLIKDNGTHVIVIGQTTCTHCISFKPAINSIAEDYNITINYLNLQKLTQEDSNKFFESLKTIEYNDEEFLSEGKIGTPLTLIVQNGKVKSYISGERTTSQLARELKKIGVIS